MSVYSKIFHSHTKKENMDTSTKFQVDKVEFEQERTKLFQCFLKEQSLTDVTLVNDDDLEISAHKVILSSISPVLRRIFERRPQDQPVLFLRGVKSDHLRALVDYIYTGEASIDVNNLNEFIQVGKDLKIVGLTDDDDEEEASNDHNSPEKIVLEESSLSIEPVKAEPIIENETRTGIRKEAPVELMELTHIQEKAPEVDQVLVASARARMLREEYFYNFDKKKNAMMTQVSGNMWKCTKCKREMKKPHLREHVDTHMEGDFNYKCRFCNNIFNRCMKFQRHLTPCITEAILNKTLTHDNVKLPAPVQSFKTVTVQEYELMVDKHLRRSGEAPHFEWTCSQCDHKTTHKDMLIDHIETMHLDQFCFQCESCRKTQTKYSVYRRHYKICLKSSKTKV